MRYTIPFVVTVARFLPQTTNVEKLRLRLHGLEKNVTAAEIHLATTVQNFTNVTHAYATTYAVTNSNAEGINSISLDFSRGQATIESDENNFRNLETRAADLKTEAAALKKLAEGGAQPQNITRVETLEQKLWDATDPTKPEFIGNFKLKLSKAESSTESLESAVRQAVRDVLYNRTMLVQMNKALVDILRLETLHDGDLS